MIRTLKIEKRAIEEKVNGKSASKLVDFFTRIRDGKVKKDELEVKYEFDLNKPRLNTETKVAKILSAWYTGITKEDVIDALKEIKVSSFEDLIIQYKRKNEK